MRIASKFGVRIAFSVYSQPLYPWVLLITSCQLQMNNIQKRIIPVLNMCRLFVLVRFSIIQYKNLCGIYILLRIFSNLKMTFSVFIQCIECVQVPALCKRLTHPRILVLLGVLCSWRLFIHSWLLRCEIITQKLYYLQYCLANRLSIFLASSYNLN